jgi:hypothetical protein
MLVSISMTIPVCIFMIAAGVKKLRAQRRFKYALINMGATKFATPWFIRCLSIAEISAGLLGLLAPAGGRAALSPLVVILLGFTCVVLVKRPSACGCGVVELNWRMTVMRNIAMVGLVTAGAITR